MNEQIHFNKTPQEAENLISKRMDLEAGFLGKFFGSHANAPMNIAGMLLVLLFGSGVTVLFVPSTMSASDYWKIIAPITTLVIGYMFGKSAKDH